MNRRNSHVPSPNSKNDESRRTCSTHQDKFSSPLSILSSLPTSDNISYGDVQNSNERESQSIASIKPGECVALQNSLGTLVDGDVSPARTTSLGHFDVPNPPNPTTESQHDSPRSRNPNMSFSFSRLTPANAIYERGEETKEETPPVIYSNNPGYSSSQQTEPELSTADRPPQNVSILRALPENDVSLSSKPAYPHAFTSSKGNISSSQAEIHSSRLGDRPKITDYLIASNIPPPVFAYTTSQGSFDLPGRQNLPTLSSDPEDGASQSSLFSHPIQVSGKMFRHKGRRLWTLQIL